MSRQKEVDAWFSKYENPMKDVVQKVREIVLAADSRIDECIKWQAPTFTFEGNLASFFPKSKKHASLMFHEGAKIPGDHPLLEGTGAVARMVKVASVKEAAAAKKQLSAIVRAWCDWRAGDSKANTATQAKKATQKKPTQKKPTQKKATQKKPTQKKPTQKKPTQKKAAAKKGTQEEPSRKVSSKKTPQKKRPTPTKTKQTKSQAKKPAPTRTKKAKASAPRAAKRTARASAKRG